MSNALTTITATMASRFNLGTDAAELQKILRETAFKGSVSNEQMVALLIVANQYGLNPWTKEIYAFPDRQNGIVPVVGVDGWSRIINEHPQLDGIEFEQADDCCTCKIYRKDRSRPITVTEYMDECRRDGMGPWKSHPRRMLRHKALIQCARLAFGFSGIYDTDEAERIIEASPQDSQRTGRKTPQNAAQSTAPEGYDEYEADVLPMLEDAAQTSLDSLMQAFKGLNKTDHKAILWQRHGARLKESAEAAESAIVSAETEQ